MAIGDVIEKTFLSKSLTATASDSTYANTSSSYRTVVTSIIITGQSAGTTIRKVTVYKGGSASANERFNIDIDPTGVSGAKTVTIDSPFVLVGTEAIFAKQDVGTDINIEMSGTEEQIA